MGSHVNNTSIMFCLWDRSEAHVKLHLAAAWCNEENGRVAREDKTGGFSEGNFAMRTLNNKWHLDGNG